MICFLFPHILLALSKNFDSIMLERLGKYSFLNFGTVFLTAMRMMKLRKAHCSPPLVDEDNSMVFTSHSVPFPATRSLVAGNGTSCETKTILFS